MSKIKITEEQAKMLKEMGKTKVLKVTKEQYDKIVEAEGTISEKSLSSMGNSMVKQANPLNRSQFKRELKSNLPEMYEKFINELYGVSESTERVYEKLHKLMEGAGLIANGKLVKEKFDGNKERVKQVINAGLHEMSCGGSAYKAMEAIEEALELKDITPDYFKNQIGEPKKSGKSREELISVIKSKREESKKETERQEALRALANREQEDKIEEEVKVGEKINLKDLTFDQVKASFHNFYQKPIDIDRDPSDEYYSYTDAINFPNPDDSLTTINNRGAFNYWKNNTLERYGDVELEFNPEAVWFDRVKLIDDKFKQDKEQYTKAKQAWMDAERESGRTSGLDELEMEEATMAGSAGAFVPGVSLGGEPKYKPQVKIVPEEEIDEATTMGGGAVPTFDIPMGRGDKDKSFWHPKGSQGPRLKGKKVNEDSQTETQWKGGSFVKVKDECNKFPYCDQGAGAIELKKTKRAVISNDHIVQEVAKKTNRSVEDVKKIINNKNI
jgi:SHS2 domain-containing protein